jgi:hypothetical protein
VPVFCCHNLVNSTIKSKLSQPLSERLKDFFPTEKRICEKCDWSHEAGDFLWALNIGLAIEIFGDKDFYNLATEYGFAKKPDKRPSRD